MTKIKLAKAWAGHRAGQTVECDDARAAQLRRDGFESKEKTPKAAKVEGKA